MGFGGASSRNQPMEAAPGGQRPCFPTLTASGSLPIRAADFSAGARTSPELASTPRGKDHSESRRFWPAPMTVDKPFRFGASSPMTAVGLTQARRSTQFLWSRL